MIWKDREESTYLYLRYQLLSCAQDICLWMRSHQLQPNTSNMKFIWCCGKFQSVTSMSMQTRSNQFLLPAIRCLCGRKILMRSHVALSCFSAMHQIRSTRKSLPSTALEMLVTSLVHCRLDNCNVVFTGLPASDIWRLQSVLNCLLD